MRRVFVTCCMSLMLTACQGGVMHVPTPTTAEVEQETQKQVALASEEALQAKERRKEKLIVMQQRLLKVSPSISRAALQLCNQFVISRNLCVYDFTLAEDERGINASADGDTIRVTPGMMEFAQTDEELAVVLGHEIAHNILQHTSSTKKNAYAGAMVGAVLDALATSQGVETNNSLTKGGMEVGTLSYSTTFESEADYVGLYITARAGYVIDNAPIFWRKMSVKTPEGIFVETTHPSNPKRFLALEKTVAEIKNKQQNKMALIPEMKQGTALIGSL